MTTSARTPKWSQPNHATGPTQAGLDLVGDEEQVTLVAERTHRPEVLGGGRVDPALALDRLEQHPDDRGVDGGLERLDVVPGDVAEALRERLEGLVLLGLAGRVQRRQGAPVEGAVGAHDDVTAVPTPPTGHLDGRLVRLGAGVGEEDPAPAAQETVELTRRLDVVLVAEQVGDVDQACACSAIASATGP